MIMMPSLTNVLKNKIYPSLLLLVTLGLMSGAALAECDTSKYRRSIVTYYETEYLDLLGFDSRCRYIANSSGPRVCRIRLRGTLYRPLESAYTSGTGKFPALIVNHGSEQFFEADRKFCDIATYFVPKGYVVFMPFRRGQGDDDGLADRSTGVYVEDMVDDFIFSNGNYIHDTTCTSGDCYRAQLLVEQADEDVDAAFTFLKNRNDAKRDSANPDEYHIGVMGVSYGGRVTVFTNRRRHGQKAAVTFSPGVQGWADETCAPNDQNCGGAGQRELLSAARNAKKPNYYLQAKWDYDTRATIDLAYAQAYGSPNEKHHNGYMAAIFPYQFPCDDDGDPSCSDDEFQSIHAGFFADTGVWGPSVLNFFRRNDVK